MVSLNSTSFCAREKAAHVELQLGLDHCRTAFFINSDIYVNKSDSK